MMYELIPELIICLSVLIATISFCFCHIYSTVKQMRGYTDIEPIERD